MGFAAASKTATSLTATLLLREAVSISPLTTGNAVTLLQDGPDTHEAMLKAIAGAREHINMETYIFEDDPAGRRFAAALVEKQRQGVQVSLIHDSVGTLATPRELFQRLKNEGVQVVEFNPVNPLSAWSFGLAWSVNQRDHRKLLVVDGETAFLGGINISNVYSGSSRPRLRRQSSQVQEVDSTRETPAWRDTHLQLQGPVVAELQKLFFASWEQQNGPPLLGKNYFPPPKAMGSLVVRAISSTPTRSETSPIFITLLSAIGSAETSIYITNAYFAPAPQLLEALTDAAIRGVDVRLILPSQTDSWLVFHAGRANYDALLTAGVQIHERRGVVLHAKTALIDGVWSTVGSTNLDWRSYLHNQEVNAVILGTAFGGEMQRMFDRDLRESEQVQLPTWRARPWASRFKEFFARLWEYWL
jgi:cardiolipin synthase A/B